MNLKNKSGFTLLEILVVIIIIGVLASLALPRFFSTVEFSRSSEALKAATEIKQSIERCAAFDGSYVTCNAFGNLDVDDPGLGGETHFTYALTSAGTTPAAKAYTITATRNTKAGGATTSNIVVSVTSAGATRTGSTAFNSIR